MNLIYLLQPASWFVESGDIWFPLNDEHSLALAQSTLPLICVDEYELTDQPSQSGPASLVSESDNCVTVSLRDKNNVPVEEKRLTLDQDLLPIVTWNSPPSTDGWVGSAVRLEVEHLSTLRLEIFLPESGSMQSKMLDVCREDGSVKQFELKRGCQTDCVVLESSAPCDSSFVLRCEPEMSADPTDVRSLGFVLANTAITV